MSPNIVADFGSRISQSRMSVSQQTEKGRENLIERRTRALVRSLNQYCRSKVGILRIRMEEKQEVEILINEVVLSAKYLRSEKEMRVPRIAIPD